MREKVWLTECKILMGVVIMATKAEVLRNKKYSEYIAAITPKTHLAQSLLYAFLIGGIFCLIGQLIYDSFEVIFPHYDHIRLGNITAMVLIAGASFLTGLGLYDKFARRGGAGSFLPITGFANAMASASMEFKTEGLTFGTSTKMFSVVGPVIVNGVVWSTVAALITMLVKVIAAAIGG